MTRTSFVSVMIAGLSNRGACFRPLAAWSLAHPNCMRAITQQNNKKWVGTWIACHQRSIVPFLSTDLCFRGTQVILQTDDRLNIVSISFFTGSAAPLELGLWFFSFMIILQIVGLLGRVISSSQGLYLNTGQHKHKINAYAHQTLVPFVGFQPTIPASERAKTVHSLERSATVTS
jgi:hypothetical protein